MIGWAGKRNRRNRVIVTMNDDEYARTCAFFRECAKHGAYRTYSHFARHLLTKGYVKKIIFTFDIRELLVEIRRIGVNINQIAYRCNRDDVVTKNDVEALTKHVSELKKRVEKLCNQYHCDVEEA